MTSPGNAVSTVSRSWPNIAWAYLVANGRPVAAWVSTIPRSKRPEHTRTNATRSRWAGSMLAWTLNTRPEKGASTARWSPSTDARGSGAGASSHIASSSRRTPKFGSAAPNSTGDDSPARNDGMSMSAPISVSNSSSSSAVWYGAPSRCRASSGSLKCSSIAF